MLILLYTHIVNLLLNIVVLIVFGFLFILFILIVLLTRILVIVKFIHFIIVAHVLCCLCVHQVLLQLGLFYSFLNQIKSFVGLRGCDSGSRQLGSILFRILFCFQLFLISLNSFDVAGDTFLLLAYGSNLCTALCCEWCIRCLSLNSSSLPIQLQAHL